MRSPFLFAGLFLFVIVPGFVLAESAGKAEPATPIPLTDFYGRPTVDLTIAGHGPFRFILDTGADVTVIDHALAERFDLEALGQTEIGSPLGGTVPATRYRLEDVRLGTLDLGGLEVLDIDLAAVLGSGETSPVGVLSTAALGKRSLVFDTAGRRLVVRDTLLPPANGADVFDFCPESRKPSLTVQVAGQKHCAIVDTGSPALLSLPLSVAEKLPLASPPAVRGNARLVGADVDVWGARLDGEVRVGAIVLKNPDITFMETAPTGNIGQGFLQGVELTLDHSNRRLRLRPEAGAAVEGAAQAGAGPVRTLRRVPRPGGRSYGIRLRGPLGAGELRVAGVEPGSPAAAGGLRAGDRVLALNGVPIDQLDRDQRMSALRGTPVTLRVDRDGQTKEFKLELD